MTQNIGHGLTQAGSQKAVVSCWYLHDIANVDFSVLRAKAGEGLPGMSVYLIRQA